MKTALLKTRTFSEDTPTALDAAIQVWLETYARETTFLGIHFSVAGESVLNYSALLVYTE